MDLEAAAPPAPAQVEEVEVEAEEEWDAEGFEIPSLNANKASGKREKLLQTEILKPAIQKTTITKSENIYLGPHGAKPAQVKQHEVQSSGKKQRLKQKIKDADNRNTSLGRENKVEVLRDLMGSKLTEASPRGGAREWLDPHCQEALFQKSKQRG